MKVKIILLIGFLLVAFISCEKYDDYIKDYKTSAVYFATQRPLRTIVAYDTMNFKVGVALGGKRENSIEEYADFTVDPSLLDNEELVDGNQFKLLPEEYYSLSDESRMNISAGEFIGDITVTLNREAFTADDQATTNTYALPLQITGTSSDSILAQKDYTILVVKYISKYDGTYYHKGIQREQDSSGTTVNETIYTDEDLVNNQTWDVGTVDATTISTPAAGTFGNGRLLLNVDENSSEVTITSGNNNIQLNTVSGTYNQENSSFYLDYSFTRNEKMFQVTDTLVLRQAPEKDLYFEEW